MFLQTDPQKTAFGPFSIACGPFSIAWFRFGFVLGPCWVRFFQKFASCLHGEHNFPKRLKALSIKKTNFFDPQVASKRAFFGIVFAPVGPLAVPIAFFSHLEPFRIPQTAHDLCIFSLRSPVNKNDRMHHTVFFCKFRSH